MNEKAKEFLEEIYKKFKEDLCRIQEITYNSKKYKERDYVMTMITGCLSDSLDYSLVEGKIKNIYEKYKNVNIPLVDSLHLR